MLISGNVGLSTNLFDMISLEYVLAYLGQCLVCIVQIW